MFRPLVETYLSSAMESLSTEEQIDTLCKRASDLIFFIQFGQMPCEEVNGDGEKAISHTDE